MTKLIGFAALSKAQRTAIASKGGRNAHALGRAHEFTSEEARTAGRKGGLAGVQQRADRDNRRARQIDAEEQGTR